MWRSVFCALLGGIFSALVGRQILPICPENFPTAQPCGIMGTIFDQVVLTTQDNATGLCCNIEGISAGVLSTYCYENILVCDQGYYVPVEHRVVPVQGNPVIFNPNSYSCQLQAVRLHIDPALAGTIAGTVCYD